MTARALPHNPTPRQIAESVNELRNGQTGTLTLTENTATTTLIDARIGINSFISFSPYTSNAAAGMTDLYVSDQTNGEAELTHANNAQTDRTYRYLIVG